MFNHFFNWYYVKCGCEDKKTFEFALFGGSSQADLDRHLLQRTFGALFLVSVEQCEVNLFPFINLVVNSNAAHHTLESCSFTLLLCFLCFVWMSSKLEVILRLPGYHSTTNGGGAAQRICFVHHERMYFFFCPHTHVSINRIVAIYWSSVCLYIFGGQCLSPLQRQRHK